MSTRLRLCADFGSTFTKAALVDLDAGTVVARAEHPTTITTDVMEGYDACVAALARQHPAAPEAPALACSSAGGGLRIAVVGNEELVTAEAGRRVALSSGGVVVAVLAASDRLPDAATLTAAAPDVVLLTGGTDGGNPQPLVDCARALATARWRGPVVIAGNASAQDDAQALLEAAGAPCVRAANVVPRIGVLAPDSARAAIREVFLRHVIGGKHLSRDPRFTAMVRGATPDVVLTGVELLAADAGTDVVAVDLGGATTDVHSVVEVDPDSAHSGQGGLSREVVATTPVSRTVEGDLGMRWSAPSTVAAGVEEGLIEAALTEGGLIDTLASGAGRRHAEPGWLPATEEERAQDEEIARVAVGLALRRHAGRARVVVGPDGRVVERSGQDLREAGLLVVSGGALRHGRPGVSDRVLVGASESAGGGWQLPRDPRVVLDTGHLLAWAGLLAGEAPEAAARLLDDWHRGAHG